MNKAEIVNKEKGFEILLHDIANDPTINSIEFSVKKSDIVEWVHKKGVAGGLDSVAWKDCTGSIEDTSAEIVSRGTDGGVITWFTDNDLETGTPDNGKFYRWVEDRRY